MPTARNPARNGGHGRAARPARDTRSYDRKLDAILRQAAAVFYERGYHQASMRDIARATGVSLAGLYYYFSSKEELLYLIQRHTFESILESARRRVAEIAEPEERLRELVKLHLQFFLEHPNEMKVLTHEEQWLSRKRGGEVRAIKRAYYKLWLEQVEKLKRELRLEGLNTRLALLSLFGMMNWNYTWYNPRIDPGASDCAEVMAGIFLRGILGSSTGARHAARADANGGRATMSLPSPASLPLKRAFGRPVRQSASERSKAWLPEARHLKETSWLPA